MTLLVNPTAESKFCLLYTSDAADDLLRVDLGGRRIIKKKLPQFIAISRPPAFQSYLPATLLRAIL